MIIFTYKYKWGYNPPPLNPEYSINLSLNPTYVWKYILKNVILCKKFKIWCLRTVYCMCCVLRTLPLRTDYALKKAPNPEYEKGGLSCSLLGRLRSRVLGSLFCYIWDLCWPFKVCWYYRPWTCGSISPVMYIFFLKLWWWGYTIFLH